MAVNIRFDLNFSKFNVRNLALVFACLMLHAAWSQVSEKELTIRSRKFDVLHKHPQMQESLSKDIPEGSGLIGFGGLLWAHNDSGPARLIGLDSSSGKVIKAIELRGLKITDWEDMSQDSSFVYIGDFGNNLGNRDCLQIYRLSKEALLNNKIVMDSISFDWPTINDSGRKRKINFDCEAMAVIRDTVFLFTKEWRHGSRSRIFKIPAQSGNFTATYVGTLRTHMLVTGASYSQKLQQVVLCGYSILLGPRLLVLPLTVDGRFSESVKGKRIRIRKAFKQVEGVTSFDGVNYYVISEAIKYLFLDNPPELFRITVGR